MAPTAAGSPGGAIGPRCGRRGASAGANLAHDRAPSAEAPVAPYRPGPLASLPVVRTRIARVGPALVALLALAGCSVGGGVPEAGDTTTTTAVATTTTTTEPPPVVCEETSFLPAIGDEAQVDRLTGADPVAAAVGFSAETFECAVDAVVVAAADLDGVALAARLAAALGGPLLFARPTPAPALEAELARLMPQRVWLVGEGIEMGAVPEGAELKQLSGDPLLLAEQVFEFVGGTTPALTLPDEPGPRTVAVAVQALTQGNALRPPAPPATSTSTSSSTTTTTLPPAAGPTEPLPVVLAGTGRRGVAWLVDAGRPALALAAAAAAVPSGSLMALVDGTDLRSIPEVGRALHASPPAAVHLVGTVTADASWQLPVLLAGEEIPGGGYLMFPGRRIVAFYGHAWAPELGIMGEHSPAESAALVKPIAAEYAEEGWVVVPGFEIIATVADARAGADGNYSAETSLEDLRPWIETAGAEGLYVILDLQPGRTDFLTQARLYEEFLRLPYVGLALDPEWRLGPNQVHLQQYGSVPASEVNEVSEWLAGLVREEGLPQKMLLLHQFRLSMLPDRESIQSRPELAIVIQMDGQGPLAAKYETWAAVTAGTEGTGWSWGWKNFYDEDSPMATPAQVLALEPSVVYVSYQ